MNYKTYLEHHWKRDVLRIVREALAAREDDETTDPADDAEEYENLLLALYPPDGLDNKKGLSSQ
jgi:hypothetical protein